MIEIIGVIIIFLLICILEAIGEIRHREYYYVKQYETPTKPPSVLYSKHGTVKYNQPPVPPMYKNIKK